VRPDSEAALPAVLRRGHGAAAGGRTGSTAGSEQTRMARSRTAPDLHAEQSAAVAGALEAPSQPARPEAASPAVLRPTVGWVSQTSGLRLKSGTLTVLGVGDLNYKIILNRIHECQTRRRQRRPRLDACSRPLHLLPFFRLIIRWRRILRRWLGGILPEDSI
jgi:hypothetical protein